MKKPLGMKIFGILVYYVTKFIFSSTSIDAFPLNETFCAYSEGTIEHLSDEGSGIFEEKHKLCPNSYCYALWEIDEYNKTSIMGQGCWSQPGQATDCDQSKCVANARKSSRARNNTKFCCCSGNWCNSNFTEVILPLPVHEKEVNKDTNDFFEYSKMYILIIIIIVSLFIVLVGFAVTVIYFYWKYKPMKKDLDNSITKACLTPSSAQNILNKLKLFEIIGEGRYGTVFRGKLDNKDVAVKLFKSESRKYYLNEREIYNVIGNRESAIVEFIEGGEFVDAEYVLILNLEQQNLQTYLINNIIDSTTLGKFALDISRGLTFLHCDDSVNHGKPCIAHRDLNSRNILVREDLSCCICDMGLSVIPKRAGDEAITEAGTLRYMAPEVLEGAVNLHECESALKQIDVYALGLILWELGTRCKDLQSDEPGPYELPFSNQIAHQVTLEQMQTLVSKDKQRPTWPDSWKDTTAARMLRETTEDCWDQDAEARLTAICVSERFIDFPNLKGRITYPIYRSTAELLNNNNLNHHSTDMSGATMETLLSPSEEYFKNSNQFAECILPLQPSQGRNPCLERNLLIESSEVSFIEKSRKHESTENLVVNAYGNCHTTANVSNRIPYLQNAVQHPDDSRNEHNRSKKKFTWNIVKKILRPKEHHFDHDNSLRNTQVKLKSKIKNVNTSGVTTSLLVKSEAKRPSNLDLPHSANFTEIMNTNRSGISQLTKRSHSFSQRSLDQFNEVFSSKSDLSQLKGVSHRVKTPGDVPPSVRRTRGNAAASSVSICLFTDPINVDQDQFRTDPITDKTSLIVSKSNTMIPNRVSFDSGIVDQGQWASAPELDHRSDSSIQTSLLNQDNGSIIISF